MSRRKKYDDYDEHDDRSVYGYDRRHSDEYTDDYDEEYEGYYSQKKPKTEKEAKRVMERAKDKKFWNCDDVDNFASLKGSIDLMYNSIPGNNYSVKYQENQNGTRLTIVCETCDKTLSSYDPFLSHENGKNHKKARQQKLTPPDPNLKKQPKNRRINTPKNIFFEDSLEEMIDLCKYTTIGVHFIYKEKIDGTDYFTCTLCKMSSNCERISRRKMYNHITGKSHMKNYLEVKHGFKKNIELEEEAKHIEELEGKIHHKIVDFTNQLDLEVEEKYSKRLYKDIKHEKPSSTSSSDSDSSNSSSHRHRKFKRSPSSRRYTPSPPIRGYRSKRSKSQSPIRKFKRSPGSRYSPSPTQSYRSKRSRSLSPGSNKSHTPAPMLPPSQYKVSDATVSVDHYDLPGRNIHELCSYIVDENNKEECISMISEDQDMQNLIINALYVVNKKLDEYYRENAILFTDGDSVNPLVEKSEDMHNFVCLLKAVTREE